MSMSMDLKYSNKKGATRQFPSVLHIGGERMEFHWAGGASAND
jgi:hypothetical protein